MLSAESVETPKEMGSQKLRERLVHAGLYKTNSPGYYYLVQLAFVSVPVFSGWLVYRMGFISFQMALILGLVMGIGGVIAPGLWLDFCKAGRQTKIRRSIPDALDVIIICVEAGLSLSAAITRVARELSSMHPLLAAELRIVHRQVQIGKTNGEALKAFGERFDLMELRSLASVVVQSEKFGSSIASALRVHSESLRKKRMQAAEEKAQKSAVWILLPTVVFIFPALFVVILGPAAYDIMDLMKNMEK
ncbi:MAG: type II secretion system F family protein [Pirellulaceae bacterium]|nr:type II secretion system F family protein [Pirellulaceae bacterium]